MTQLNNHPAERISYIKESVHVVNTSMSPPLAPFTPKELEIVRRPCCWIKLLARCVCGPRVVVAGWQKRHI